MHVRRRAAVIAVVVSLGLGVVGCGGDPPEAKPAPSTSAAAPSPTPTGPVAPELPADAKREDEVGAKAFVRHWLSVASFAMQTGDVGPLEAASAPECEPCAELSRKVDGIYGPGGRLRGGGWSTAGLEVDPHYTDDGERVVGSIVQAPQVLINERGKVVSRTPEQTYVMRIPIVWTSRGWAVASIERVA